MGKIVKDRFYSVKEAAEIVGKTPGTIKVKIYAGELKSQQLGKGRSHRILGEDLLNFLGIKEQPETKIVAVANQKGTLGKLAFDDSLYENLKTLSDNLNDVTSSINNGDGTLGKLINEDGLYNEFHSISERLNTLLTKTESDSTFAGGLLNDGKFYRDFNSLINDLDKLIIDLKENPDRYVQFSIF